MTTAKEFADGLSALVNASGYDIGDLSVGGSVMLEDVMTQDELERILKSIKGTGESVPRDLETLHNSADAAFIAAAPELVRGLLEEIELLRAEREELLTHIVSIPSDHLSNIPLVFSRWLGEGFAIIKRYGLPQSVRKDNGE